MENSRENMYKFLAIVFPTIEFSPVKECEFKDIVIPMFVEFYYIFYRRYYNIYFMSFNVKFYIVTMICCS
jgi:hypothetical protein